MALIIGFAVVFIAAVVVLWINDNTKLGGEYFSDDDSGVN